MPWIWLSIWIIAMVGSVVAHEAAHVLVGVRCGWTYMGVFVKPSVLGVGVKLEANGNDHEVWKIASAGPATTLALAAAFWTLSYTLGGTIALLAASLCTFNLFLATVNLLPLPFTDGGLIVKGVRHRHKSLGT